MSILTLLIQPFAALIAGAFGFLLVLEGQARAAPRVVATIKPVHSLATAILDGVAEPKLLLKGAASPHSYALKPSDAEALSKADAIILVSGNLEVFLGKAIKTLPAKARVIDLEETPGLNILPVRQDARLIQDEEGEAREEHGGRNDGLKDVHFWLDPVNAMAIADRLAAEFSAMDPAHAAQYGANAKKLKAKLAALDEELRAKLAGLTRRPFIVFHDVTQYFEKRYGLNSLGAITLSPERVPGAKRLETVRARIKETQAICVFSEPQFPPKLVQMLTMGTKAKQGVLDEIGTAIPAGAGQYFALMRANAQSLADCLRS
ncbi:MAG: zinc ABC transporter substrate-binding protein [Rhodomicrobium sp.]|nr:zinc ABC transporter substrate-binding protein [Rhodomicrobium sp.]